MASEESLAERLRRLREAHTSTLAASSPSRAKAQDASPSSTGPVPDDDIEALIASTRAELEAGGAQQDDDDATLGNDDDEGDVDNLEEELGATTLDSPRRLPSMADEAKTLSLEADRALKDATRAQEELKAELPSNPSSSSAGPSSTLILERLERPRPELVHRTSSQEQRQGDGAVAEKDELERELRAAMEEGEDEDEGSRPHQSRTTQASSGSASNQPALTAPSTGDVDDLTARLSKLRAGAGLAAFDSSSTTGPGPSTTGDGTPNPSDLATPPSSALEALTSLSVPTDLPVAPPSSEPSSMRERHGIETSRDLSSFSKLVRLDAKGLAPPSERRKDDQDPLAGLTAAQKKIRDLLGTHPEDGGEEEDRDMEGWCAICNDDASLLCVGCDYEKYCSSCWAEGHERMAREELMEHGTREYRGWKRRGGKKGGDGKGGGHGGSGRGLLAA